MSLEPKTSQEPNTVLYPSTPSKYITPLKLNVIQKPSTTSRETETSQKPNTTLYPSRSSTQTTFLHPKNHTLSIQSIPKTEATF